MTAHLVGTFRPQSPEWFAARSGLITGSRIAAVLGLSPWESPFSLYHRMVGTVDEQVDTPETEWGTRLEASVLRKFADEHPEYRVRKTGTWVADLRLWQGANPDGLLTTPYGRKYRAVVEAKTAARDDGWGTEGTDEIPVYYRCQVLWYLDVLGLDLAHVPVLIGGNDYREYVVRADNDAAQDDLVAMRRAARAFLVRVAELDAPDLDEHGATYQVLRAMHPDIDGETVDLPGDLTRAVVQVKAASAAVDDWMTGIRSRIADHMGTAKYAHYGEHRIADRRAKSGGTPYVQLARSLPELETIA